MSPRSKFCTAQRGRLHYLEWGDPASRPLILLHGSRDHARSWDDLAARLQSDWRVIAPDLRGHGDSDWSGEGAYVWLLFVYDLAELIRQLGLAPVSLIAHSLGGQVGLQYAALYPENIDRLVVVEGIGVMKPQAPATERWRRWIEGREATVQHAPVRYGSMDAACERLALANPRLNETQVRHLAEHGLRRNDDGTVSWKYDPAMRSMLPLWTAEAEDRTRFGVIDRPVLLVRGGEGWARDPVEASMIDSFPDARSITIDGAGHWPHHDQFDAFADVVSQFLGRGRS